MIQINPRGLRFSISEFEPGKTLIHLMETEKDLIVNVGLKTINQGWYDWTVNRAYVQTAFWFLNENEREFLMTGITPDEWKEMFKNEKTKDSSETS